MKNKKVNNFKTKILSALLILAVLATGVIAGSQGKGFKFGIDVKTGWWGIPTGVNFVCGIR